MLHKSWKSIWKVPYCFKLRPSCLMNGIFRLSVHPSVCPSHIFHHVPTNISSWNVQELLPWTEVMSMQKVKVRGQRSRSQRSTPVSWLLSRVYTIRDATRHDATRRDAIWRDIQVLFTLCATSSRAVTWQQGIWDPEQMKLCNLNGCFDPTWHCVYLTDIPPKITSICITQPHKHITWNTNS